MSKVIVTGGAGLIGSHLVRSLTADDVDVLVLDRLSPDASPILRELSSPFEFVQMDVCDIDSLLSTIRHFAPDTLYHLAAQPLSQESNRDPLGTVHDNILGTYSVLEGVRRSQLRMRVVHASSACFYGVPEQTPPLNEDVPPAVGHYIYTATKVAGDFAVRHYRQIFDLEAITVRMVNVYGPGDVHDERIVPRLINQALDGVAPSLTQSDGSDVLSFLYIDDAVRAFRTLGEHPQSNLRAVWNLAGPSHLSVTELMELVYEMCGRAPTAFEAVGERVDQPVHKYLDGSRIRAELGFVPEVDLQEGLARTIEWYEAQRALGGATLDTAAWP